MTQYRIVWISYVREMLDKRIEDKYSVPIEQLLAKEANGHWVTVDNRTRDFWMEDFETYEEAIEWLNEY